MFFKNKAVVSGSTDNNDIDLLMEQMQRFIDGDFSEIDTAAFENKELAEKYNAMLNKAMDNNNRMLARLNDSMNRIGDSELIKNMLEEVGSQTNSINTMENTSTRLENSIENISLSATDIRNSSHSIIDSSRECMSRMNESLVLVDESVNAITTISDEMESFKNKTRRINDIIDNVMELAEDSSLLGLNASIEAARAGEAGRGFAVVAEQVNQLSNNTTACAEDVVKHVNELMEGIENLVKVVEQATESLTKGNHSVHNSIDMLGSMNGRLEDINHDIDKINDEISNQSEVTNEFIGGIRNITDGYRTLSSDCKLIGERFYRISRDIDSARGFEFRSNSRPTLIDTLKVYKIDHLIFTWRIYNHIAGFEVLKLTQLNNPQGCKIGKWFAAQNDPRITTCAGYQKTYDYHQQLHDRAVESWEACESGDREGALQKFYEALECFENYKSSIEQLIDEVRNNGLDEETPVWVFNPQ